MKFFKRWTALLLSLLLIPTLAACADRGQKAVGTCGDCDVLYEELYFEVMTQLEKQPDCTNEELWNAVESSLRARYAILSLYRKHVGEISLEDRDLIERAEADVESMITSLGGKSEYRSHLEDIHASEHFFFHYLKIALLQLELEEALFKDTELSDVSTLVEWWKNGNCSNVVTLIFPDLDTANAARAELNGGKKVEELTAMSEFSAATVQKAQYYFRGLKQTALETAACDLKAVGQVSDAIQTEKGFCVLVRTESDYEALKTYQAPTALDQYREQRISGLIDEAAADLTVTLNEYGTSLDLKNLK